MDHPVSRIRRRSLVRAKKTRLLLILGSHIKLCSLGDTVHVLFTGNESAGNVFLLVPNYFAFSRCGANNFYFSEATVSVFGVCASQLLDVDFDINNPKRIRQWQEGTCKEWNARWSLG